MSGSPLVLDAEGLAALSERRPPPALRALMREAFDRDREILVPAVVCAEVCRGSARTRSVEAALGRHDPMSSQRPGVRCVDTDFDLARRVGAVLYAVGAATADLVDAHVVALCAIAGGGLVITSDADDILRLAQGVPAARIVTRRAR
jgi:predicted nucleic acid-binding protein